MYGNPAFESSRSQRVSGGFEMSAASRVPDIPRAREPCILGILLRSSAADPSQMANGSFGRTSAFGGEGRKVRKRRDSATAVHPGECPLTERTAGVQAARQELVFMPHTGHCPRTGWGASAAKRAAIHYECGGYSMTSSARARINCGIVKPSSWAVLRFTTKSNFTGSWIGKSAALAPFKMRST